MKCLIIEDQAPAQRVLKKYISDFGNLSLSGTFNNPLDALEYLKNESVDLIFLDIHLPKISGLDFLKVLSNPPSIILTTAFSEYAVESYEFAVVDYLVKPFSFERFVKAVSKVAANHASAENPQDSNEQLFIKSGHEYIQIKSEEIVFIHSDMDYTEVHLDDRSKLISSETLTSWENNLDMKQFVRVHKSYLINILKISKVVSKQIYLTNGKTIPLGRAYKENFLLKVVK